jgi:alkylation response protein AidB-like acyl-CoA dehydrogenase
MNEHYSPPLEDQLFLLERVLNWDSLFALPEFAHADSEEATSVLTQGARFTSEVLSPINRIGDEQGSRLENGRVVTPDGFREAFHNYSEVGWPGLDLPRKFGGQNLPLIVQAAFAEMVNGACASFGMLPLMLRAAAWLLIEHAEEDLRTKVVPNLVTGKWGATICISEPQAGSDVGRISTQATPRNDDTYALSATKIFITYGDHDWTDQIIHMILARTPDAPPGTRGLSLFLVPKYTLDNPEVVNGISISGVEKKMGLKASPTCVLHLDEAIGYRVGSESKGLKCMFTMVTLMRLEVAIQGVAIAGAVTQMALNYALDRPQGGKPNHPPVAIIEHADVRRMLFVMRSKTEAMRALVYEAAFNLDLARAAQDERERIEARHLAEFLLPVCKACASETGFEVASLAVQVLGGHGYICDAGVEQYLRDSRVMAIYEGTSGIQALDLVTRKLLKDAGKRYHLFTGRIRQDLDRHGTGKGIDEIHRALGEGLERLDGCTEFLQESSSKSARDVEAAATDYLHLVGLVAGAWMWLRMATAATEGLPLSPGKKAYAQFYAQYLMPEAVALEDRIRTGIGALDSLDIETLVKH